MLFLYIIISGSPVYVCKGGSYEMHFANRPFNPGKTI